MIAAILDTNVVLQAVISSPATASARTLDAYYAAAFQLISSPAVLDEWLQVLCLPRMRDRHGMSDDEILDFLASLLAHSRTFAGETAVAARLPRDVTDTKFLSLAADSQADYLVTNDRRHLLPLKKFQGTQIVTPAQFLKVLR